MPKHSNIDSPQMHKTLEFEYLQESTEYIQYNIILLQLYVGYIILTNIILNSLEFEKCLYSYVEWLTCSLCLEKAVFESVAI